MGWILAAAYALLLETLLLVGIGTACFSCIRAAVKWLKNILK